MTQKNIRDYNNQEFTVEEAAAWLKELNDRTRSGQEDYNSINELATKVKVLESTTTASSAIGDLSTNLLSYFNQQLNT